MKTVQDIKQVLISYQNLMAQNAASGNSIYGQMANDAWVENGMHELSYPSEETFGGKLWHEFCNSRMYSRMSEKQAFWIAIAFAQTNGLDPETVAKYAR